MSLDPATPAPPRRGLIRIAAVVGVVVLLLVAAWFAGRSWAGGKADDYRKDVAAWQEKHGAALVASTTTVPSDTYLSKDMGTTKGLARQKKGCAEVADIAAQARSATKSVPTVSAGFAGLFSADLRDAADEAKDRRRQVAAYATRAADVFEQIHVDCTWNIAFNTPSAADRKTAALYKKSDTYLDAKGPGEGNSICSRDEGCISNTTSKRLKYAALRAQAYRADMERGLKLYDARCATTSYGAAMCRAFRDATRRYGAVRLEQAEVVRTITTSVDSAEIDRVNAKWNRVETSNQKNMQAALKKAHPAAYEQATIKKSPAFTDPFLRFEASQLVASLATDRAELAEDLPNA